MGEVFHALEVLNRTMKLGLSGRDLLRAEMGFKSAFAQVSNPDPTRQLSADPVALAQDYELVATLRPRKQKLSLEQLSSLAHEAVAAPQANAPQARVADATFAHIDQQLGAVKVSPQTAAQISSSPIKRL